MRRPDLSLSLRREGDRIYFVVNLVSYGYWTLEDFARMKIHGDKFWAADFTALYLPHLRPCDPECASCGEREGLLLRDERVHGELLCDRCRYSIGGER
jgi:hypothetical protein